MKKNVISADRIIRFVIAAVLIGAYFGGFITGTIGILGLVVAAIMAFTAAISFCPVYAVLGLMGGSKTEEHGKSGVCCGGCGSEDTDSKEA